MPSPCEHVDQIQDITPDSTDSCTKCVEAGDGWVHLRVCLVCGHVGCCDSSKNKHATKHYRESGHPVMQSYEPNEAWRWCYVDRAWLPEAEGSFR